MIIQFVVFFQMHLFFQTVIQLKKTLKQYIQLQ